MSKEQTPIEIEAKLMFDKMLLENEECTSTEMMVAFAQSKVLEALENKKECLHDWVNGSLGTEWIIECSKCERDLFDVYNQEDAVKILRNRSKTKL